MNRLLSFFDKSLTIRIPIRILTDLPFVAYLIWEIYWFDRVGYAAIKWHTHLMPFVYFGMICLSGAVYYYRRWPSESVKKFLLTTGAVIFSLFLSETVLIIFGFTKTHGEKVDGYYRSPYSFRSTTYYHTWLPGKPHWLIKQEYSFPRPTNSLGFADNEWKLSESTHEKAIMTLGDSFTEEDGAPYDSCYPELMRRQLAMTGDSFYVMNAGVCGSDPFYDYIILRDRLLAYKPDFIIQSIGSDDMDNDIVIRGGLSRFRKDGTVRYRSAPWWEPLYAGSYLSRVLFQTAGYGENLVKTRLSAEDERRVFKDSKELFDQYAALCKRDNIRLIVVLHPAKEEIRDNKYEYDFAPFVHYLSCDKGIKVIDLLPYYQSYIDRHHEKVANYFWREDGHHNSAGYKMMAETTLGAIYPLLRDSLTSGDTAPTR